MEEDSGTKTGTEMVQEIGTSFGKKIFGVWFRGAQNWFHFLEPNWFQTCEPKCVPRGAFWFRFLEPFWFSFFEPFFGPAI